MCRNLVNRRAIFCRLRFIMGNFYSGYLAVLRLIIPRPLRLFLHPLPSVDFLSYIQFLPTVPQTYQNCVNEYLRYEIIFIWPSFSLNKTEYRVANWYICYETGCKFQDVPLKKFPLSSHRLVLYIYYPFCKSNYKMECTVYLHWKHQ